MSKNKQGKQGKLTNDQISAIADQLEARLQASNKTSGTSTRGRTGFYLLGAASGLAFAMFAPSLRPAMRSAVKGGILAGRYVKRVGSNIKEELEDITAEAKSQLNTEENNGPHQHPHEGSV